MTPPSRNLIVNADDFGASDGINRGILEAHVHGVLTSASLMVTGAAAAEAVALAAEHTDLSVGLHWDLCGEDERDFPVHDRDAVRDEFRRQLEAFERLTGTTPTHVDSHRHVHRESHLREIAAELVEPIGVPLRGDGDVSYVGGFYGQWEWLVTDLEHVSPGFLEHLLRTEVGPGWTEIGCHPGFVDRDFHSVYVREREAEVATLTDPRIPVVLAEEGIALRSYADVAGADRTGTGAIRG